MAACDFNVCTLSAMAWMLARMRMNFLIKFLVRTRSFAMIFTASIWPLLAIFLMSTTSFFSWRSRLVRSRSSSRITCWLRTWRRRWTNTELKLDEEETVRDSLPHSQPSMHVQIWTWLFWPCWVLFGFVWASLLESSSFQTMLPEPFWVSFLGRKWGREGREAEWEGG